MSAHSDREVQFARRQYASGDIAFDRRADALALRNKLRREYERRSSEQDPMACGRCGKELVRCLAKQDVTDCCYHRGELCATRKSRGVGVLRWSCCHLTGEGATGCQRGGRHKYEAIHPTFEDWFEHWATVTGQGSTHVHVPLQKETHSKGGLCRLPPALCWCLIDGILARVAAIPRDQVRHAAVPRAQTKTSASSATGEAEVVNDHRLLPPRARWVLTCQRAAWAYCQHRRLGQDSPASLLSPDIAAKVRMIDIARRLRRLANHSCLNCI